MIFNVIYAKRWQIYSDKWKAKTILISRGNLSKIYRFPRLIDTLSLDFRFNKIAFYVLIQHILILNHNIIRRSIGRFKCAMCIYNQDNAFLQRITTLECD